MCAENGEGEENTYGHCFVIQGNVSNYVACTWLSREIYESRSIDAVMPVEPCFLRSKATNKSCRRSLNSAKSQRVIPVISEFVRNTQRAKKVPTTVP